MPHSPTSGPSTATPLAPSAAEAGTTRVEVIFGSTSGRTEELAERIGARLSVRLGASVPVRDVAVTELARLAEPELVLLGVPTWNVGELQADWDAVLDDVARLDLRGAHVALFGAGDAACYPDTFGDALGIVAETVETAGATVVGHVPADGYAFEASRAMRGDRLVGLLVDDRDDEDVVRERIERWCDALLVRAPLCRSACAPSAARLRAMRVSELLDAAPEALSVLLRHGFRPLSNPHLRTALAPTVTLDQACRIRGVGPEGAERVIRDLQEVWPCR